MRNVPSLVLIFGICIFGVAERFQNNNASGLTAMDDAPAQHIPNEVDPKIPRAERERETASSAPSAPLQSLPPSNLPEMPAVQWPEAESFLQHLEQQTYDLEAKDVDKFNALIREAGRITRGLSPELRQQFKDKLFVIIDKTSQLPPLPKELYEFEK